MKLLQTTTMALLLATSFSVNAAGELREKFSDTELVQIFKSDGFTSVEPLTDGLIVLKINGTNYIIHNEDDGDLTAYSGYTGYNISLKNINTWNQNYRLSRAYLDDDNDPVIESDLLTDAGINEQHVTDFFNVFLRSANVFESYIHKHNQD